MTDKVQKIREVIEKRYEYWREKEHKSHSIESEIRMSECQHLLLMLNSLQEEPVSEELEEASRNYADNEEYGDDVYFAIKAAFKVGAKWKDEQIIKNAIDTTVCYTMNAPSILVNLPSGFEYGDKVKVTILKGIKL